VQNSTTPFLKITATLIAILLFEWLILSLNKPKTKIPRKILDEELKRKERRKYNWTIKIEELGNNVLRRLEQFLLNLGFTQYNNKFYSNDSIVILEEEDGEVKILVFSSSLLKIADLTGKIEMEVLKCSNKS